MMHPLVQSAQVGLCVTKGSHFTCHPRMNHTCLYTPAARHHRPFADILDCAYPRRDARLSWPVAGSINQSINLYRAIVQRRVLQCGYAESKRNVLRRILNVLTDEAVRQFSGREFQSLGAAAEKRRAAVSKLCGGTDRSFCVDDRSKRDWLYGLIKSASYPGCWKEVARLPTEMSGTGN